MTPLITKARGTAQRLLEGRQPTPESEAAPMPHSVTAPRRWGPGEAWVLPRPGPCAFLPWLSSKCSPGRGGKAAPESSPGQPASGLGALYGKPKVSRKTPHKYLLGVKGRKSPPVPSVAAASSEASHQASAFRGLGVPDSEMGVVLSPPPSLAEVVITVAVAGTGPPPAVEGAPRAQDG